MKNLTGICLVALALSALALAATPALADSANILGVFQNWTAYSAGSGSDMVCYALSTPRASQPRKAKRSAIYLMVSDWPGRHIKAEPQIVLGYAVKDNAPASLGVGAEKFPFFIRASAKDGYAWISNLNDSPRLLDSMGKGVSVVAAGISARGTKTTDTYSLQGFGDALAKIHSVCNM